MHVDLLQSHGRGEFKKRTYSNLLVGDQEGAGGSLRCLEGNSAELGTNSCLGDGTACGKHLGERIRIEIGWQALHNDTVIVEAGLLRGCGITTGWGWSCCSGLASRALLAWLAGCITLGFRARGLYSKLAFPQFLASQANSLRSVSCGDVGDVGEAAEAAGVSAC
jgi:hypothetical protein